MIRELSCIAVAVTIVVCGCLSDAFSQDSTNPEEKCIHIATVIGELESISDAIDDVSIKDAIEAGLNVSLPKKIRVRMLTRASAMNAVAEVGTGVLLEIAYSKDVDIEIRTAAVVVVWAGLVDKSTRLVATLALFKIADDCSIDPDIRQSAIVGILLSGLSRNAVRRRLDTLLEGEEAEAQIAINSISYAVFDNAISGDDVVQMVLSVIPRLRSEIVRAKALELIHHCQSLQNHGLDSLKAPQSFCPQTGVDIDEYCKSMIINRQLPTIRRSEIFAICDPTHMSTDPDVVKSAKLILVDPQECKYAKKLAEYILDAGRVARPSEANPAEHK